MPISASMLRQDIYRILDRILATGEPIEIERNGRRLMIVLANRPGRLDRLSRRDYLVGDPEEIVEGGWLAEWRS